MAPIHLWVPSNAEVPGAVVRAAIMVAAISALVVAMARQAAMVVPEGRQLWAAQAVPDTAAMMAQYRVVVAAVLIQITRLMGATAAMAWSSSITESLHEIHFALVPVVCRCLRPN